MTGSVHAVELQREESRRGAGAAVGHAGMALGVAAVVISICAIPGQRPESATVALSPVPVPAVAPPVPRLAVHAAGGRDELKAWDASAPSEPAAAPAKRADGWTPRPRRRMVRGLDTRAILAMADWEKVDWRRVSTHPALWWEKVTCMTDPEARCGKDSLGRPMVDSPEGRSTMLSYNQSKPIESRAVILSEDATGKRIINSWKCMAMSGKYAVYVATVLKRRLPTVAWRPPAEPRPSLSRKTLQSRGALSRVGFRSGFENSR